METMMCQWRLPHFEAAIMKFEDMDKLYKMTLNKLGPKLFLDAAPPRFLGQAQVFS